MEFTMQFIKYHALGNDYLVLAKTSTFNLNLDQFERVCDLHYELGADDILILELRTSPHFKLRISNPDGSDAEKSGNGLRIFSRYRATWGTDRGLRGTVPDLDPRRRGRRMGLTGRGFRRMPYG
jgi:diaminopimelate epimerase